MITSQGLKSTHHVPNALVDVAQCNAEGKGKRFSSNFSSHKKEPLIVIIITIPQHHRVPFLTVGAYVDCTKLSDIMDHYYSRYECQHQFLRNLQLPIVRPVEFKL